MDVDDEATDAIRELINIGVGRAAGMLNDITGCSINLQVPKVVIVTPEQLAAVNGSFSTTSLSSVALNFNGPMSGLSALIFPQESASSLVMLMTKETEKTPELDAIRIETLKEVGNIIINAVMGSIANVLQHHLTYSVASYQEVTVPELIKSLRLPADDRIILANAHFRIENTPIDGNILLILEMGSMDTLLQAIGEMTP
ncbi:MAG: chemotaxis protein CheC [Methanomicrobiales archaeon]|nr:chemotaxis protein CheC [Methanomicrobiales archaeon]